MRPSRPPPQAVYKTYIDVVHIAKDETSQLFSLFSQDDASQSQSQAQSCPCSCAQPSLGLIGPDGLCQCSCASVPIPGISEETLAGPPKPPKAGGPEPTWNVEPGFDDGFGDGFGGPFWGGWW